MREHMAKKKSKKTAKKAVKAKNAKSKASDDKASREDKRMIKSLMSDERVLTESSDAARELYNQGVYGILKDGKVQLSLIEALYLAEKGRIEIRSESNRKMRLESFIRKAKKLEPNFWVRYCVFRDMRNRGYVIKTALKFGADFRVYDRGVKPGEDHAKWVVYPVHESSVLTWYEFAAKNRVAHSTKKRLLIGIVDDEDDVTYYEIRWTRP
ncbi:tRNA-intron lyase [Candidatus Woesearchaeota archaeon]|nr:tRNA-intron lyase [Candidatus Woesearchaeota archaeon]